MKTTSVKYTCDRCGKEIHERITCFFKFGYIVERITIYNPDAMTEEQYSKFETQKDLCRECRKNLEVWLSGKNA